jgi:hypothetical protein
MITFVSFVNFVSNQELRPDVSGWTSAGCSTAAAGLIFRGQGNSMAGRHEAELVA